MRVRRAAALVPLVAVAALVLPGFAFGGEYTVAQCHAANAGHQASTEGADRGDYGMRDECGAAPDNALKVLPNSGAPAGHSGHWYWEAPPGTKIVGVDVDAKLRRSDGHKARLYLADAVGRPTVTVATGGDDPTSFAHEQWSAPAGTAGWTRFYAALVCDNNGDNCPISSEAKTFVRNVELKLRDTVAPSVAVDAPNLSWVRGYFHTELAVTDIGAGVEARDLVANGVNVASRRLYACQRISGTTFVAQLAPCALQALDKVTLNSATHPFHDGLNNVTVCGRDFGESGRGNVRCESRAVAIDNTAPDLAFHNAQAVDDPELIRASAIDVTSGVAASSASIEFRRIGSTVWEPLLTSLRDGELQARVDSEARPEGMYEFRASASDVAGNSATTLLRAGGSPMRLQFPLKQEADLDAFFPGGQTEQTAAYKEPSKVRGFLLRPDGTPIADEEVIIEENFDEGSLLQRRTERVRTDVDGGFVSTIPGGPSREIDVSYAGSRRYRDDAAPELDYDVKGSVSLSAVRRVRAGNAVRFKGRVGRYFARIPAGGKLVELQFKKRPKTWNTAKEALGTTSRGRVQIPYRFRRYYTEPVTFVFRLKVTQESAWPYRLPVSSKPVQVTVLPHRR